LLRPRNSISVYSGLVPVILRHFLDFGFFSRPSWWQLERKQLWWEEREREREREGSCVGVRERTQLWSGEREREKAKRR
jgi:hypothetical protein